MQEYILTGISIVGGLYILHQFKNKSKNEKGEKYYIRYVDPDDEFKPLKNHDLDKSKVSKFEDAKGINSKIPADDGTVLKHLSNPDINKNMDYMIKTKECVGFVGIGTDHATTFHLLIIPRNRNIRWYKDLTYNDIDLLEHMKYLGECWVEKNKRYLDSMCNDQSDCKQLQFGFHLRPNIGYLTMHMLVGPNSTEADKYVDNWVSYDKVVSILKK